MGIGPRFWSSLGEFTLVDLAVNASLRGDFWFGKSNKELLTSFAEHVKNLTGENVTYECVLQKMNDLYNRYTTWQWITQQQGIAVDVNTMNLVASEEVWARIMKDKPNATVYKFKPEKFSIALDIIFGYPLKVHKNVGDNVVVNEDEQEGPNVDIIELSDDDSKMIESHENQPINLIIIEDSSTVNGHSTTISIPSQSDTYGYSSASSPYPPTTWKE